MMAKSLVALLFIAAVFGCKDNKKTAANDSGQSEDILNAYKELKLPFSVTDSTMEKVADTSTISFPFFTQFVPDTIFNNPFGKDRKLTIRPIGKIQVKNKETYL